MGNDWIVDRAAPILITGSSGFIGSRVVESLLNLGFTNLRCFVRPSSDVTSLEKIAKSRRGEGIRLEILEGNLLSPGDCERAARDVSVIYHLAAGRGEKSYPNSYMNSVVTTRNLLEVAAKQNHLRRFVNVSSFTVYSTRKIRRGGMLDESCEMEQQPERRGEAYCYAKVRQDEIVMEYGESHKVPYVIVRPGVVYGPGNKGITGRVGLGTFGLFLHLGGSNKIPLTYVDNCADAIALAGIKGGVDREVFNVVDDDLPTSRKFLGLYKKNVRRFRSVYVPRGLAFLLCCAWEKYSDWSKGQLQPVFNRKMYGSYWKGNRYSNEKLKRLLGWNPRVPFREASRRYFEYQKEVGANK